MCAYVYAQKRECGGQRIASGVSFFPLLKAPCTPGSLTLRLLWILLSLNPVSPYTTTSDVMCSWEFELVFLNNLCFPGQEKIILFY